MKPFRRGDLVLYANTHRALVWAYIEEPDGRWLYLVEFEDGRTLVNYDREFTLHERAGLLLQLWGFLCWQMKKSEFTGRAWQ